MAQLKMDLSNFIVDPMYHYEQGHPLHMNSQIRASQYLSSISLFSLSVGSNIRLLETGQERVGA